MVKARKKSFLKLRIGLVYSLCILMLLGLWVYAFYIQIVRGPYLASKAHEQHWSNVYSNGDRGEILDCRGHLLAKSVDVSSVFARPGQVADKKSTAKSLSHILDMRQEKIYDLLRNKSSFVWVARKIGDDKASKVRKASLDGLYLTEDQGRFYPNGHLAGQLLGFVGVDNHGLEGLELSFDQYLAGKKKSFQVQRDGLGHILYASGQFDQDQLQGQDIHLTIDTRIQLAVEEALKRSVDAHQAKSGMGLVIEVETGKIRAWGQYPFFNPNKFQRCSSKEWRNKIVLDLFEPGSTLKPFLVAAALEEDVCQTDKIYFCEQGCWRFHDQVIEDTHDYGWLPVNKIIRYSSNIGAGKIGLDLGKKRYYRYLAELGFGRSTKMPLPAENKGVLRPPSAWNKVDLVSAAFGHGLSLNALQLGRAFCCLANHGKKQALHIIEKPDQGKGRLKRVFSSETCQDILQMMEDVVQEDGTGTRARIEGFSVGGKTGTAQKATSAGGYGDAYVATFIGLFPSLDPEYLILVVIDEPEDNHYGGVVAAPAVRDIALNVITYSREFRAKLGHKDGQIRKKGTGKTSKILMTASRKVSNEQKKDLWQDVKVPDFNGWSISQALVYLGKKGIVPDLRGQGVFIREQSPDPGQPWAKVKDNKWVLWLDDKSDI